MGYQRHLSRLKTYQLGVHPLGNVGPQSRRGHSPRGYAGRPFLSRRLAASGPWVMVTTPRILRRKRSGAMLFTKPSTVDRKSTRLNSSHGYISYAVFCLKKKKKK